MSTTQISTSIPKKKKNNNLPLHQSLLFFLLRRRLTPQLPTSLWIVHSRSANWTQCSFECTLFPISLKMKNGAICNVSQTNRRVFSCCSVASGALHGPSKKSFFGLFLLLLLFLRVSLCSSHIVVMSELMS